MSVRRQVLDDFLHCLTGSPPELNDWQPVLQLASETLTIGTLADRILGGVRATLPPEIRDLLTDLRCRARTRNQRLLDQLMEALPELNAAGIEPIVMRGMARLLDNPSDGSRLLSDIDLLIPAEARDPALQILEGLGYRRLRGDGEQFPLVLGRVEDVGTIDLHLILQPRFMALDFDRLAPHCRTLDVGDTVVLLPSPTAQALMGIVHDQLHDADYWRGLVDMRHLIDLRTLARDGIDWPLLESFFPAGPARTALHTQLRTAQSFLRVDVPAQFCGGAWAALQVRRRRLQVQHPSLMPALTMLTMLVEPPVRSPQSGPRVPGRDPLWKIVPRRIGEYLRPPSSGKLQSTSR